MTGRTRTVIAAACITATAARVSMQAKPCSCFTSGSHGAPVVVADGSGTGPAVYHRT
jgi:hypothetical protein